jgi:hypothetical protein
MRHIVLTIAAIGLMATAAYSAQQGPANSAVKSTHDNNSSTPVIGADSFTMDQAKSLIEAKG